MVDFTVENNDQLNIPSDVLRLARKICRNTHVIDMGSGKEEDMHIDFAARAYTRIDRFGVVKSPPYGLVNGLSDAVRVTPINISISLVLFRSFSCFSIDFLQSFARIFDEYRSKITNLVIYDYALDARRIDEYDKTSSPFGVLFQKNTEWHNEPFYHYTPEMIGSILSLQKYQSMPTTVPAMKHSSAPGFFMHSISR